MIYVFIIIFWSPGYNGGLHTIYFIEVWESNILILNLSNPLPFWKLRGLGPGKALKLVFYAYNARGRSEPAVLKVHTPSRLAIHIGKILKYSEIL